MITLYALENSRSFRVSLVAYQLGLSDSQFKHENFERIGGKKAQPEMAEQSGFKLGKSPFLIDDDGDVEVFESQACVEYLVERYGKTSPGGDQELIPALGNWRSRSNVLAWMAFSETLMLHVLAIVYSRWFGRGKEDEDTIEHQESMMINNVKKDMQMIQDSLNDESNNGWICEGRLTAADAMILFSAEYTFWAVPQIKNDYLAVQEWCRRMSRLESYQRVTKNGPKHEFTVQ